MRDAERDIETDREERVTDLTRLAVPEEELMRRTAEGDESAMAELVRRGGDLPAREMARAA
jgi:hypothetical protein